MTSPLRERTAAGFAASLNRLDASMDLFGNAKEEYFEARLTIPFLRIDPE
jgi:hypothetical protein